MLLERLAKYLKGEEDPEVRQIQEGVMSDTPVPGREDPRDFPIWQQWREWAIPRWRNILAEAQAQGDRERVAYAQWMLSEVLGHDR